MSRPTPLGAVVRGVVAGAVGTAALDLVGYARYRRGGGEQGLLAWDSSAELAGWDAAPAPALVGKRVVEGLFQIELEPPWARATNNIMHWGYGTGWGAAYGILAGSLRRPGLAVAGLFGPVVWASGYVVLPLARLYKPIWRYDAATLLADLGGHLVYGLTTAVAFRLFNVRPDT
ncbi:MAG: hypothetical protein ACRDY2_01540 [Acidimicrobiales bacterium]